jgi:hypothetical protein
LETPRAAQVVGSGQSNMSPWLRAQPAALVVAVVAALDDARCLILRAMGSNIGLDEIGGGT